MITFIKHHCFHIGIIYVYRGDPENQARKLDVLIRATVKNTDTESITKIDDYQ